jgi:hypothetical protein
LSMHVGKGTRELLRILAVAACAAGALSPFFEWQRVAWVWLGAGLAAAAALAGVFVTLLTRRRRTTLGMVGGIFARFFCALVGLCACMLAYPKAFTTIASALLVAYLALVATELLCACRQARAAGAAEVQR